VSGAAWAPPYGLAPFLFTVIVSSEDAIVIMPR
jgi:hypothetical protein